jgi:hypothetical protein
VSTCYSLYSLFPNLRIVFQKHSQEFNSPQVGDICGNVSEHNSSRKEIMKSQSHAQLSTFSFVSSKL